MAEEDPDRPPPPSLDRVQAFSDGVFAIAITLLILPLTEAQVRDGHVVEDLLALQHQFLGLGLSFVVIGRFWLLHHEDLRRMTAAGRRMLVANLVFLFFIVLLPFPTALLGEGDSAAATVIYALTLIATSSSGLALWWSAERDGVVDVEYGRGWGRRKYWATGAVVLGFLPSLPLAILSPSWARISWALVIPLGMLADCLEERRR
ncbi:MAG: Integral membrane protein [uncultured Actinomycetospora sp.]|uniref:Integral membrane protein n=1 Tax=uncultured Actinomycetospora sp. TaxID=1135996 RepID=A0A6J4JXS3_9PSEU|nr:MAG: Integral membrane protein [uncultured Actinomycetospora sp.]